MPHGRAVWYLTVSVEPRMSQMEGESRRNWNIVLCCDVGTNEGRKQCHMVVLPRTD